MALPVAGLIGYKIISIIAEKFDDHNKRETERQDRANQRENERLDHANQRENARFAEADRLENNRLDRADDRLNTRMSTADRLNRDRLEAADVRRDARLRQIKQWDNERLEIADQRHNDTRKAIAQMESDRIERQDIRSQRFKLTFIVSGKDRFGQTCEKQFSLEFSTESAMVQMATKYSVESGVEVEDRTQRGLPYGQPNNSQSNYGPPNYLQPNYQSNSQQNYQPATSGSVVDPGAMAGSGASIQNDIIRWVSNNPILFAIIVIAFVILWKM